MSCACTGQLIAGRVKIRENEHATFWLLLLSQFCGCAWLLFLVFGLLHVDWAIASMS